MEKLNGALSCEGVKGWDMVAYLSHIGYEPQRVKGQNYWYLSPLRSEQTPSFKVARNLNVWYDHCLGKGGNLLDFCILYYNCSIKELLQKLRKNLPFHPPLFHKETRPEIEVQNSIQITEVRPLLSPVLLHYLASRKIAIGIGQKYCREISFLLYQKRYRGLGFLNASSGCEIRNSWFKGSAAPKDITHLQNGCREAALFEGFFDFLSYLTIYDNTAAILMDFFILNSLSFFERSVPLLQSYDKVHLYLDRDKSGQKSTAHALSMDNRYRDESDLYRGYKDLNDWHCNMGKGSANDHYASSS